MDKADVQNETLMLGGVYRPPSSNNDYFNF